MACYCEICGRELKTDIYCRTVVLDGITMTICLQCYRRLAKQGRIRAVEKSSTRSAQSRVTSKTKAVGVKWSKTNVSRRVLENMYEIVEDYAKRIKSAREKMGWSQKALAQRVKVSENIIKRIETGRLKPSIDLARHLEKVLGIVLLEPIVEEYTKYSSSDEDYLTIGDIIKFRKDSD